MCSKDLPTVSCRLLRRKLPGLPSVHVSRRLGPGPGPLRPRRNQLGLIHLRNSRRGRNVKRKSSTPWPTHLQESNPVPRRSDQPQRGRTTSRADPPRMDYPLEEKKRRSSSRPCGVVEPKRGRSSGAEPSWDVSQIGSRQTGKPEPQPSSGPELPEPKLKSIVKLVHLSLPKPADLESLGPVARSRYDTDPKEDRPRRERSRHRADTLVRPKDCHAASRILIKARNDLTTGSVDMIGSPVKAPATSPRRMRVWVPSCWPGKNRKSGLR